MDTLNLSLSRAGDRAVIHVAGNVDITTAGQLREFAREVRSREGSHLIFDLVDVTFMDSTGLHALADAAQEARLDGGSLMLARLRTQVAHLLRLSRTGRNLLAFPSVDQALHARGRSGAPDRPAPAGTRGRRSYRPAALPMSLSARA